MISEIFFTSTKENPLSTDSQAKLQKTLGPLMLWGLGVGYVISGMYFGWNLGLPQGGTLGMALATGIVIIMYTTFTFSYTELACSMPKAGGAFIYAHKALGPRWGFLGGMAQNIEFIFAPPAIAFAIGAYLDSIFPGHHALTFAVISYFIFTFINILGVKLAATFELFVTVIAVIGLLLFSSLSIPHFEWENFRQNALPNGYGGVFAALPFAIWFFLAIEGLANVAEETTNPQKNILLGFSSALITLVLLCLLTYFSSIGIQGWEAIVYKSGSTELSDAPLPLALQQILGKNSDLLKALVGIGLFGLIASFHGIILAAGRTTFEFGRMGYAPSFLGKIHPKYKTPALSLIVNMLIGIIALLTGKTGEIITIACFGALTLYFISMVSFFKLRKDSPTMPRPFKVMGYPYFPAIALILSLLCFVSMAVYNPTLFIIYLLLLFIPFLGFELFIYQRNKEAFSIN